MSAQQSDSDSSNGWTIISNKGSDIKTAHDKDVLERPLLGKVQHEDTVVTDCSLDESESVEDKTVLETLCASELVGGQEVAGEEVLCFSDHSDIVSLDYLKEKRNGEESEDVYFGAACSSLYTFLLPNTVELPAVSHTSSSEDQAEESSSSVLRRRRQRRTTASTITREEETEEDDSLDPAASDVTNLSVFNSGLLPIILLVFTMAVYSIVAPLLAGNLSRHGNRETVHRLRLDELQEVWEMLQTHMTFQDLQQLDDQMVLSLLIKVLQNMHRENQDFHTLQDKALDNSCLNLESLERTNTLLEQQRLSLATMQAELESMHLKIQHPHTRGVVGRLQSQNRKLRSELDSQRQLSRNLERRREESLAEVRTLRCMLGTKERVREALEQEVIGLKAKRMEKEEELVKLRSELDAAQQKLSMERQRSDMWERLYVESTAREKGDREFNWRKTEGVADKLKKTFESAKEAVNRNLRKVKRTFHRVLNKVKGQGEEEERFDSHQQRPIREEKLELRLQNYLWKAGLYHNWPELKPFISQFFRGGVFVHHQMPFQDFICRLKSRLAHINGFDEKTFEDLDFYMDLMS